MKRLLALTGLLCLPLSGQMQMQMPMKGMPAHTKIAPSPPRPNSAITEQVRQQKANPPQPAMPSGALAAGATSLQPRPAVAVPTPVAQRATLQEQEHPERLTGSADTPTPDLLADAKGRAPEPLQFFLEGASKNNPTLRQGEGQVRRLHAEAKQAGLWQNPEIGYEADHVRGGSYAGGEQGGYVQQTIPLLGQRSSARAAISAQATAAEVVLWAQRQRVESAVAQAFYAALAVQWEVELRGRMVALASDAAIAAHQFANVGQADAPDVLASEVEREQAKLELASAQRAYRKAWAALAAISGDAALPIAPLSGDLTAVPMLHPGAELDAAEGSPMVKAAQQQAAASVAAIRSARKQAGPQLILKVGLQQDNEPLQTAGRVGVVGIAQAGITVPLWKPLGRSKRSHRQKSSARNCCCRCGPNRNDRITATRSAKCRVIATSCCRGRNERQICTDKNTREWRQRTRKLLPHKRCCCNCRWTTHTRLDRHGEVRCCCSTDCCRTGLPHRMRFRRTQARRRETSPPGCTVQA